MPGGAGPGWPGGYGSIRVPAPGTGQRGSSGASDYRASAPAGIVSQNPLTLIDTVDSGTLGDTGVGTIDSSLATSDLLTLNDLVGVGTDTQTTDSITLTEVAQAIATLNVSAVDSALFSDTVSSLGVALAAIEAYGLGEAAVPAPTLTRVDSGTWAETASLSAPQSVIDSGSFAEALQLLVNANTTDPFALTEQSAPAPNLSRIDSGTAGDSSSLASAISANDAIVFTEISNLIQTLVINVNNAITLSELAQTVQALSVSASEIETFSDVSSLAPSVNATDQAALTEARTLANTLVTIDAASFAEAVAIATTLSRSEALALTEAVIVFESAVLNVVDSIATTEARTVQVTPSVTDSFTESESGALANTISTSEAATLADAALLLVALATSEGVSLAELADKTVLLDRADAASIFDQAVRIATTQIDTADSGVLSETAVFDALVEAQEAFELFEAALIDANLIASAEQIALSENAEVLFAIQNFVVGALLYLRARSVIHDHVVVHETDVEQFKILDPRTLAIQRQRVRRDRVALGHTLAIPVTRVEISPVDEMNGILTASSPRLLRSIRDKGLVLTVNSE